MSTPHPDGTRGHEPVVTPAGHDEAPGPVQDEGGTAELVERGGGREAPRLPLSHRLRARTSLPAVAGGTVLLVVGVLLRELLPDAVPETLRAVLGVVPPAGLLLVVWGAVALLLPRPAGRVEPRVVACPVAGTWAALNSPATRTPSHGTHGYGQTWAVDLVAQPDDGSRPVFGQGAALRPPEDFPAFGRPVRSPVAGTVVTASDGARDHRSRSSWYAVLLMVVEGAIRELGGPGRLLGNHVVVDAGDGSWCLLAHLRRGSVAVRAGDVVRPGDLLGACGSSGNTSEPHLHLQLMDHRRPALAAGLPLALRDVELDGRRTTGLPGNGEVLRATVPTTG